MRMQWTRSTIQRGGMNHKAFSTWRLTSPSGVSFEVPDEDVAISQFETPVASCDDPAAPMTIIKGDISITITVRASDPQVG